MAEFTFSELVNATNGILLNTCNLDAHVSDVFTDTRIRCENSLFIALAGENFDAHDYLDKAVEQGASILCVEKSKTSKLPSDVPALIVESTLDAYQNIAAFHRRRFKDLTVIALTGSCGKTSTKETLYAIFSHAFGADKVLATKGNTNNQIGVPQNLLRLDSNHRFAIIEMGTNHHGEIEPLAACALPDAALIVSIARCHLEFLGSLEGVAREKGHIFKFISHNGFGVIPYECPAKDILAGCVNNFAHAEAGNDCNADFYSDYKGGNLNGASFVLTKKSTNESVLVKWSVPGAHQASNAALAAAMADHFCVDMKTIGEGIARTTLPGMRMRISEHHNATWINDAYNANPDSMKASLTWLSEFADQKTLVVVLGDMVELGENSLDAHRSVLELAMRLLPDAKIIGVGSKMSEVAPSSITVFPSSAECAKDMAELIIPSGTVFLKASRMTKLELCELS